MQTDNEPVHGFDELKFDQLYSAYERQRRRRIAAVIAILVVLVLASTGAYCYFAPSTMLPEVAKMFEPYPPLEGWGFSQTLPPSLVCDFSAKPRDCKGHVKFVRGYDAHQFRSTQKWHQPSGKTTFFGQVGLDMWYMVPPACSVVSHSWQDWREEKLHDESSYSGQAFSFVQDNYDPGTVESCKQYPLQFSANRTLGHDTECCGIPYEIANPVGAVPQRSQSSPEQDGTQFGLLQGIYNIWGESFDGEE